MQFDTLTIVGVGLIGGSIGLAAKKYGAARHVRGVGRDPAKLQCAQRLGAIDSFTLDLADGVAGANLVVFCTPVDRIAEQIISVQMDYSADAIITDAGSTKADIVRALAGHELGVQFAGSHPLAGSEKQGVEHASADLFVNRWTVLTPSARTAPHVIERLRSFCASCSARRSAIDALAEDHDLPWR